VSDTYPPGPSTPGPQEPAQPSTPEYLEAGGGSRLPPVPPAPTGGGGRRRGLLIGGGVAALALVGVGAWAAAQFFATGSQPAEALPAGTLGYVSIDLDPSGGQKIEELRTLNRFPAFKDEIGLDTDDDIREKLFEELDLPESCKIFYAEDIEPWLGDRFALAAVDTGAEDPVVVGVVQVKDADQADTGMTKLRDCANEGNTDGGEGAVGWVIDGDWAVVGEDQKSAQAVVDAADQGTLADDGDFKTITSLAGSAGIVTMYAAPGAGQYIADSLGGATGLAGAVEQGFAGSDVLGDTELPEEGQNPMAEALKNFKGLAVSVRFDDGALEVEAAGDTGLTSSAWYGTDQGADVLETLPADTEAAFGMGFEEGWLTRLADQMASYTGGDMTPDELFQEASDATGLDVPDDIETLLGDSVALSFGSGFDPEAFFNSSDGGDLPVALKVKGDPDAIQKVLDKINAQDPSAGDFLGTDVDGDTIVIGPNDDYRAEVAKRGTLGDDEVYQDVVRESDRAGAVLFVNFNAGDDWLVRLAGDDPTVKENLQPLGGFGITAWHDDDWSHTVLRLTTD
jgi:hypothetical protein